MMTIEEFKATDEVFSRVQKDVVNQIGYHEKLRPGPYAPLIQLVGWDTIRKQLYEKYLNIVRQRQDAVTQFNQECLTRQEALFGE